jgi:hypothetical protein
VQDADHLDDIGADVVVQDMVPNQASSAPREQVIPTLAELGMVGQ